MRHTCQVQTEDWYLLTEATMADGSPTVRMRQLGMELRRLRENAGKEQDEAAEWVGLSASALSRFETAKRRPKIGYVRSLLELYGVGSPHAEALLKLAQESDQRGWWAAYGSTVPAYFADYLGMETAAAEVWTYESEYIPGLLQTQEYAEVFASDSESDQAKRFVGLRSARQKRLTDDNPLILRTVLNEAVLRRIIGGPEVMRSQVRHLSEMAGLSNVTLQLLPFSAEAHPAMTPFAALRFPEDPMNTVYIELDGGALYFEKPKDVARYTSTFGRLSDLSLSEEETITRLREVEDQF